MHLPFLSSGWPAAMIVNPQPAASTPKALDLPVDAVLPDYGDGGLYGLTRSFADYLDGAPWSPPGLATAEVESEPRRSLAFVLIDGLGDHFLQRHGPTSFLATHRRGRLTSVFPSTTASAVTTSLTGLSPAEHGLTGWFIRDDRFGGVLAPLPMTRRDGEALSGFLPLPRLFPYRTLFQHRQRASIVILPDYLAASPFSRRHTRGARVASYDRLDGMVASIAAAAETLKGVGGYVHAYYPVFDALSHTHGCNSDRVQRQFWRIDAALADLAQRLHDLRCDLVISADHGFIDSAAEQRLDLADHRQIASLLDAPLAGERRATFAYVRPDAAQSFEAAAHVLLNGRGVVVRSEELLQAGFFGPGRHHRRLPERIGTHAILMNPGWTLIDHVEGEPAHDMIGFHGGLTADEMYVPLVIAGC